MTLTELKPRNTFIWRYFIVLFVVVLNSASALSQTKTSAGTDFWFGFMRNANLDTSWSDLYAYVSSSASDTITGTASIPGMGWSQDFTVAPHRVRQIKVPLTAEPLFAEGKFAKAVHIVSSAPVTVVAQNTQNASDDATLIFPTPVLRNKYYILNWNEHQAWTERVFKQGDEVLIVSTKDSSQIKITPCIATDGGHPAGVPYVITLNRGETYQMINKNDSLNFSGTVIESLHPEDCKNFAVFSGNSCASVGGCDAADHLFEQLLPITELGQNYILPPLKDKQRTIYRMMAVQDNTVVTVNGSSVAPFTLNKGQINDYLQLNNIPNFVSASHPLMMMQYAQGYDCDQMGDPFELLLYANNQFIKEVTFKAIPTQLIRRYWYVNIVVKTEDAAGTVLDGQSIANAFSVVPSNSIYSFAQVPVDSGDHTLLNAGGFLAYVYAFTNPESYGYCAGAALTNISDQATEVSVSERDTICSGSAVTLFANGTPAGGRYLWMPGNVTGDNITVRPESTTSYSVTYTNENTCQQYAEAKTVVVVHPRPDIHISPYETFGGCAIGDEIVLKGSGADHYHWWSDSGEDFGEQNRATIRINQPHKVIFLSGSNEWQCSDTAGLNWYAGRCCDVFVPNAFSPNGDGTNDFFETIPVNPPKTFRLEIYNRWGQRVFQSYNPEIQWDGRVNGTYAGLGTYFYRITGDCADGSHFSKNGDLTLIR